MPYPSDLTDEQWDLLEPVFNAPGKRGRRHADDLRSVVDAMLASGTPPSPSQTVPFATIRNRYLVPAPGAAARKACAETSPKRSPSGFGACGLAVIFFSSH